MMSELVLMSGYGLYVWSSFIFTLACFGSLFFLINAQLKKEQRKFKAKYINLNTEKSAEVNKQKTYIRIPTNFCNWGKQKSVYPI